MNVELGSIPESIETDPTPLHQIKVLVTSVILDEFLFLSLAEDTIRHDANPVKDRSRNDFIRRG